MSLTKKDRIFLGLFTMIFCVSIIFSGCSTKTDNAAAKTDKTDNASSQSTVTTQKENTADETTVKAAELPEATAASLPRWRGFNLLDKFNSDGGNSPFSEDDFKWISELGFNYVRLPMDYRAWILNNDWNQINEAVLKEIDQAVEWGRKYGVHVDINFHRAPGYTVNSPKEPLDLWTNTEAQQACARHWAMFAKRYKGVPNKELSFNLMNEPANIDNAVYAQVVNMLTEAIHKEDPERLIIADGNSYATVPITELVGSGVAQSMHNYQPFGLTHYQASWVEGSDKWPVPQWPIYSIPSNLYGSQKPDLQAPMIIEGNFKDESELILRVQVVSNLIRLKVKADGKEVFNKLIESTADKGEAKEVVYKEEWKIYQNVFDRDYTTKIPAGTKKIEIEAAEGDWMTFSDLTIKPVSSPDKAVKITPTVQDWGVKPASVKIGQDGSVLPVGDLGGYNKAWLKSDIIEPWIKLRDQGVGVIIGEWGVYSRTPHDVALKYMQDCLEVYKEVGLGWALWNFRGEFGILDSNRSDVQYEDFNGHMLDKRMLELLQKY